MVRGDRRVFLTVAVVSIALSCLIYAATLVFALQHAQVQRLKTARLEHVNVDLRNAFDVALRQRLDKAVTATE